MKYTYLLLGEVEEKWRWGRWERGNNLVCSCGFLNAISQSSGTLWFQFPEALLCLCKSRCKNGAEGWETEEEQNE